MRVFAVIPRSSAASVALIRPVTGLRVGRADEQLLLLRGQQLHAHPGSRARITALRIARWEAWSPGLADTAAWSAWAREPRALACEGAPDLRFMPPLERRRCDQLSRMMLDVAHRCSSDTAADALPCVFASRHGSICTTAELLEQLALDAQISPASFSHSVHNTQLGLFSIFARNRRPSMSVAAAHGTFAHGFLETASLLHRERGRPVLFVTGDEPLPAPLDALSSAPRCAYALALRLEPGDDLRLSLARAAGLDSPRAWPDALEFLRWWLGDAPALSLDHTPRRWTWTRAGGARA